MFICVFKYEISSTKLYKNILFQMQEKIKLDETFYFFIKIIYLVWIKHINN